MKTNKGTQVKDLVVGDKIFLNFYLMEITNLELVKNNKYTDEVLAQVTMIMVPNHILNWMPMENPGLPRMVRLKLDDFVEIDKKRGKGKGLFV